ncbi:hypothetical protein TNIN_492871 [Trichonephila inaurata madagascariensis]|uniref:Uncharacterized protein n=1 Tax=Trichonephila inaurata madagascariensis TaxID=2747483 RepID=A0A8X7CTZ2_9ARAC|nr:hypothetical protein TNIN_492871 [Trichonephila inaurata madagascariensis]
MFGQSYFTEYETEGICSKSSQTMMPLCDTMRLSTDAIEVDRPPCRLHIRVWQQSLKLQKPDSLEIAALYHPVAHVALARQYCKSTRLCQ